MNCSHENTDLRFVDGHENRLFIKQCLCCGRPVGGYLTPAYLESKGYDITSVTEYNHALRKDAHKKELLINVHIAQQGE